MIVDHTNVGAAFRRLSLPVAFTLLGDQMLSIVDTIVIGALGTVALAGATGAFTLFILVLYALLGFVSGLSIICAQRIGAGDLDGFARTVRAGTIVPLAAAIVLTLASLFAAEPVLRFMLGPLASVHQSAIYLQLRIASMIFSMVSIAVLSGLGAAGNRSPSVVALVVINAVHIPLVMILTLGVFTHHPLGMPGAGISSLVSEIAATIYVVVYLLRHPEYAILRSLRIDWRLVKETARLSLPEVVFLGAILFPDTIIVAMLAPMGPVVISAFRALNIVSDFTFIVPIPLQEAAQTVIGQRLGALDIAGAKDFFVRARRFATMTALLFGAAVAALAWPISYVFTLNAAVASLAALPLALHMITLPLKGYSMLEIAPLRASGDTRFSMFVGLLCSVLVLPVTWIGIKLLHIGLFAVPLGWIVAWSARTVLTSLRVRTDDWTRRPLTA